MDKQGRLTRLDEWKEGRAYRLKFNRRFGAWFTCCDVNKITGVVVLIDVWGIPSVMSSSAWKNRFVPANMKEFGKP